MHVMLDLETLATGPDAVILTLGAVKFDPFNPDIPIGGIYIKPDVDEQIERGRLVDEGTVAWWGEQDPVVREEALGEEGRVPVEEMYKQLNRFLVGADGIWAQGPVFDIAILENLYRQYGWPFAWSYWQIMDSRTAFKMHGDPRVKGKEGLHNAYEDCISQARAVQKIYSNLDIKPRFSK